MVAVVSNELPHQETATIQQDSNSRNIYSRLVVVVVVVVVKLGRGREGNDSKSRKCWKVWMFVPKVVVSFV